LKRSQCRRIPAARCRLFGEFPVKDRLALACALALLCALSARAEDKSVCGAAAAETGHVRAVTDGRTVQLADGREVRLGGIEAAPAAKAALEALVLDRDITLAKLSADGDRYGRVVALVTVGGQPVQQALLAQGHARVSADIGVSGCAAGLLAAEKQARDAGLGLWNDPYYVVRKAEEPENILAVRGHFAIVKGKILSVREFGGLIYVNFGRRWSDDFTVTVLKRNERRFMAAGLELKKLSGQTVRVRGTIEERGGPWIEAAHPEQIEIAERD
jgi:endonuclease YncB( thermonuclease family)